MPSRTFVSQEENKAAGFKVQKDRLTLLFAGNAYGDAKLKPMLVYRSKNPRALKNCDKEALPVIWRHNKKAWITRREFTDWFSNYFVPFIETYNKDHNLDNKAMLILDNASVHPVELGQLYPHIKIVFLPPNTTSLIQPLDQGIIANFKVFYLRCTLEKLAFAIAENNEDIRSHWKKFNIKMAVAIISESWAQVSYITMNNCWKQLWPECIKSHVDEGNALELSKTETLNLFQQVGFENINQEDIDELLTSHQQELENEELLQIQHFPVIYDSDEEILEHNIVELNSNSSN